VIADPTRGFAPAPPVGSLGTVFADPNRVYKFTMVLREQYTNFTCDLNQIYKSNLCFDPKKILTINEIE
jgi:hypothetical protein